MTVIQCLSILLVLNYHYTLEWIGTGLTVLLIRAHYFHLDNTPNMLENSLFFLRETNIDQLHFLKKWFQHVSLLNRLVRVGIIFLWLGLKKATVK